MRRIFLRLSYDGKLPEGAKKSLSTILPFYAGKEIFITVQEKKEHRSSSQNSYYWKVIVPHVRKMRFDRGDPVSEEIVHEDLLYEFSPRVEGGCINTDFGQRPMRSKEMSVKEFAEYVTAITAAMAAFGVPVPIMGEVA